MSFGKTTLVFAIVLGVAAFFLVPWLQSKGFRWRSNVEKLKSPVEVRGWNSDGLILADGRPLQVPAVTNLPALSPALDEAIQQGVEINNSGEVFVLVRVWHWCGNDPVRYDLRRVNLSEMLAFLRVGVTNPPPQNPDLLPAIGGRFTKSGWDIGEYEMFTYWTQFPKDER